MKIKKHCFVLASGGTGGHVFPSVSVYKELEQKGVDSIILTDKRGQKFLKKENNINVFPDNFSYKSKTFYCDLFLIYIKLLYLFIRNRPKIVIGFGGYPSLPTVLAAQTLLIPTIIHEQNTLLGKANRLLSKAAKIICLSFVSTKKTRYEKKLIFTGNPVRQEFLKLYDKEYKASNDIFNMLVIGGSQGAGLFCDVVPKALALLSEQLKRKIFVFQQSRQENIDKVSREYRNMLINYEIKSFFEDIPELLEKAHLIISRAGASAISEIAISGTPSILIPFAKSKENDQYLNAEKLHKNSAAFLLKENNFTPEALKDIIEMLMINHNTLKNMSSNVKKFANCKSSKTIADLAIFESGKKV